MGRHAQARGAEEADPLAPWRGGVVVRPVWSVPDRHTIHTYFNLSPESPDGRGVLLYSSTDPAGNVGQIVIMERVTGREKVLARNVTVEDAHRAACQQWVSGGRRVVYHDLRDGQWLVVAVDVDSGEERILARGRQVAWGQAQGDLVPIYGPHWEPGEHRDLEVVNVATGEIRKVVTAAAVKAEYPEWVDRAFGDKPISIFFPILSPDLKRVLFKMAMPTGGGFRSGEGSLRLGLVVYDLDQSRFLLLREDWGHPSWLPDSRTILEPGPLLIDSDTRAVRRIPDLPAFRGAHPSPSPDGRLLVTDCLMDNFGGAKGEWGVIVADMQGGQYVTVHRLDNSRGARSWRRSHPHPVFSPDGRRIYFNVNSGPWTELYAAEAETSR